MPQLEKVRIISGSAVYEIITFPSGNRIIERAAHNSIPAGKSVLSSCVLTGLPAPVRATVWMR